MSKSKSPGDDVVKYGATIDQEKFNAFLGKVKTSGVSILTSKDPHYFDWHGKPSKDIVDPYIRLQWVTGGECGGSCWDTGEENPHHPVSSEPEPVFTAFDKILEAVAPNISFFSYKSITPDVVEYSEYTENEYYGNYTVYGVKTINLKKLYAALKNRSLIED